MSQATDTFPVSGVVKRIFRGDDLLEIEDEVCFTIAIAPTGAEILDGPYIYQDLDRFIVSSYMEVFLNGRPPDLEVPPSESCLIENLTLDPTISVPEKRVPLIPEEKRIRTLESSSKAKLAIARMRKDAVSKDQEQHKWDRETRQWIKHPNTAPTQTTPRPQRWWQFWR